MLDEVGRIVSTREPEATCGPLFAIVRSATACAWAMRADLPADVAGELDRLAGAQPPASDLRDAPAFADRYASPTRFPSPPGSSLSTMNACSIATFAAGCRVRLPPGAHR